jgi:hypothetical protein
MADDDTKASDEADATTKKKSYKLPKGTYVGTYNSQEITFDVPASGTISTDDAGVQHIIESSWLGFTGEGS